MTLDREKQMESACLPPSNFIEASNSWKLCLYHEKRQITWGNTQKSEEKNAQNPCDCL